MTFLSGYELTAIELRKAAERRARQAPTPQHAACEAAVGEAGDEDERAREVARRVQHEADPYLPAAAGVVAPDMDKAFRDAYLPPADYPQPISVNPEDLRRGPLLEGRDALGPGYEPPLSFPAAPPPRYSPPGWSFSPAPSPGPFADGDCP